MSESISSGLESTPTSALIDAPSVFFVSLPKSGTVFTWYSLQDTTGLKLPEFHKLEGWSDYNDGRDFSCPDLYACGDYNTQLLLPKGMKKFTRGFIFGSHMQASYHNMRILKESGINRITVLLRDPRDAFVSWVHHLNTLGPSARNYHSKIYHVPRNYYSWSLAEQFSYQIRTFLPIVANWVEGWLDYYASADKQIEVQFVYYDELKCDPLSYIKRITDFHAIKNVDLSKIVVPEQGKMHFRKGEHGQWATDFSLAEQTLSDELLGNRILEGFAAAAVRHPCFSAATEHMEFGDARAAADNALKLITDFPNYRPAYEILLRSCHLLGHDETLLRDQLDSELHDITIASSFIYRAKLINKFLATLGETQVTHQSPI